MNQYGILTEELIERVQKLAEQNPDKKAICRYVEPVTQLVPVPIPLATMAQPYDPTNPAEGLTWVATKAETTYEPQCIVGAALVELGVEPDWFVKTGSNRLSVLGVLEKLGMGGTSDQIKWLDRVQRLQDNHLPWERAVHWATHPPKPDAA